MSPGSRGVSRTLGSLLRVGTASGLTDGQLLERFANRRGEAREHAFAALVERHGPMVFRACRGVLRDEHEAEDAFQATFLILARKSRSLWVRDSLGPWLHRVACRTAGRARAERLRREALSRRFLEVADNEPGSPAPGDRGLLDDVHEEIDRLAERYRVPLVLCDLEGHTYEEAARQLGLSVGTVKGRLARARKQLRSRLESRDFALSCGLWHVARSANGSTDVVRAAIARTTIKVAVRLNSGQFGTDGVLSLSVASLVEGAMKAMFVARIKSALLACCLVATGAVVMGQQAAKRSEDQPAQVIPASIEPRADRPPARDLAVAEEAEVGRELDQLDLGLLAEDVQELRDRVKDRLREKVRAERRETQGSGLQPERVRIAQGAYEAARASYLARARELRERQRSLGGEKEATQARVEKPAVPDRPVETLLDRKVSGQTGPVPAPIIGSVDMDSVFSRYEKTKQVSNEFMAWAGDAKKQLNQLHTESQNLADTLGKLVTGTPDFLSVEKRIAEAKINYEARREMVSREASEREARYMSDIYKEIQDVITAMARKKGLAYVVKSTNIPHTMSSPSEVTAALNRQVIYADARNDLTDEVVAELNRRFSSAGGGTPK